MIAMARVDINGRYMAKLCAKKSASLAIHRRGGRDADPGGRTHPVEAGGRCAQRYGAIRCTHARLPVDNTGAP